jgi:hypothetical protein
VITEDMAFAAGNSGGIATGIVMGGFLCLGLVMAAIAGTIILSLISIYTPSHGVTAYGDQFQVNPLMLKTLYTNSSNNTFSNSSIAGNTALNTLCVNTFTAQGSETPYGCVVDNHYGWGPNYNDSFSAKRRRRMYGYSALYSIARSRIFYYTTCGVQSDKLKYYNNATSSCVRARLAACNALFNNSAQNLTEWTPVSSLYYSIVNNPTISYVALTIYKVFGVRTSTAISEATSLGIPSANFTAGCQYIGPIARSDMAAIISAQSTQTTTLPTSTQYTG